jgi:hypothetical protein
MDLDIGGNPGVLMATFYPWCLWCQVYNRPGKSGTDAEFAGESRNSRDDQIKFAPEDRRNVSRKRALFC